MAKSKQTRVIMGVKDKRFRIVDEKKDNQLYESNHYWSNGNATRGGKAYCKRNNYKIVKSI